MQHRDTVLLKETVHKVTSFQLQEVILHHNVVYIYIYNICLAFNRSLSRAERARPCNYQQR